MKKAAPGWGIRHVKKIDETTKCDDGYVRPRCDFNATGGVDAIGEYSLKYSLMRVAMHEGEAGVNNQDAGQQDRPVLFRGLPRAGSVIFLATKIAARSPPATSVGIPYRISPEVIDQRAILARVNAPKRRMTSAGCRASTVPAATRNASTIRPV
jgi:hypothetical protein